MIQLDDHPLAEACPCIVCGYARQGAPANDVDDGPTPAVAELRARGRRTITRPTLSAEEVRVASLLVAPADARRPRTRGDCIDGDRPCPWVSCKFHLYLDVLSSGSLKLNHPRLDPWELEDTCVLDVAEGGAQTLEAARFAEVRAFLIKYYGARQGQEQQVSLPLHTVTAKARFGLVTIAGEDYEIADIGMRMLVPRELFAAQGFPADYRLDALLGGQPLSKTAQIRCAGNSVCPPVAEAIVAANTRRAQSQEAA